jgi:hypothetical protein
MKQPDEPHAANLRLIDIAVRSARPPKAGFAGFARHLMLVHPAPPSHHGLLQLALHLLQRFAATQGKDLPGFSQDAADFLVGRRWGTTELARRVWRAVAANRGSLITAADLSDI